MMSQLTISSPIRLFIVGENRLFIEVFTTVLKNHQEIELVGFTINPDELLETAKSLSADIVLVDAPLKRSVIIQIIQIVKTQLPEARIILLGLSYEDEEVLEYIEAGISGYILKQDSMPELLENVKLVYSGQTKCSTKMAGLLFGRVTELSRVYSPETLSEEMLTKREEEILPLIAEGLSNKEIAKRLGISLPTVKSHVHAILNKIKVNRRKDLISRIAELPISIAVQNSKLLESDSYERDHEKGAESS